MDYEEKELIQKLVDAVSNLARHVERIADKYSPRESYRGYSSPCIVTGQMIATPDGSVPVEQLQEGEAILAYDFSAGRPITTRVRSHRVAPTHDYVLINGELAVTGVHELYSDARGWTPAASIRLGDSLRTMGGPRDVEAMEIVTKDLSVFALTVEEHACFFASGYLVHNKP